MELDDEVKENGFDILHSPLSNTITIYLAKDSKVKLKFEEPPACDPKWDEIPSESFTVSTV